MNQTTIGILLYGSSSPARNAFAEEKYRILVEKMLEQKWNVKTLTYNHSRREELRNESMTCQAILVWINPIEPGLDRLELDTFLRELANLGILVSAHPDSILKIGTKEVLVNSRILEWSVDACVYHSLAEFEKLFPAQVHRDGIRVLKQYRGNGGQGVWKVTGKPEGKFEVISAARGARPEIMTDSALIAFFNEQVFVCGSHLIDQLWIPTIRRGMVRAYLCGTKVVGFGYQEINALFPVTQNDDFTRRQPSRRYYFTEECFLFQRLRRSLEDSWIPTLLRHFQMHPDDLPLIWDADFFFGESSDREFLLCEINASCVSPFPESAITPMIRELKRRLNPNH